VAPLTAVIEYVFDVPEQTGAFPLIVPGVAGVVFTVTANVCTEEEPHALLAFTVMFPPDEPAVALMLVVVDVPDHPEGNVQV
jgi:hypothetical protein